MQYEVKLILQYMINVDHYLTLETLNSKLENLELSNVESKNRPTTISQKTLNSDGNTLKQNGLCFLLIIFYNMTFCSFTNVAFRKDTAACRRRVCA